MSSSAKQSYLPITLTPTFMQKKKESDSTELECSAEKLTGLLQSKSWRGESSLDFQPNNE